MERPLSSLTILAYIVGIALASALGAYLGARQQLRKAFAMHDERDAPSLLQHGPYRSAFESGRKYERVQMAKSAKPGPDTP